MALNLGGCFDISSKVPALKPSSMKGNKADS